MKSGMPAVPDNRLQQPLGDLIQALQGSDWAPLVARWAKSPAGAALIQAVDARVKAGAVVYPGAVFRALKLTPVAQVRVVILGQDPYHGAGQAEGLAFSVPDGQPCPPSLRNIFKELHRDLGLAPPPPGRTSLASWAGQGVLLLNASLTVEAGLAGSHSRLGWHALTHAITEHLLQQAEPMVFMLWGAHAQAQVAGASGAALSRHGLLRCNHPSPLSALRGPSPFLGCGHFSRANAWLQARGRPAVHWQLDRRDTML